jgi:hypothetical protein
MPLTDHPAKGMNAQVRTYRTASPVMVRPMTRRWISEVPSKMVKFSDVQIRHLGHSGDQASDLVADPSSMVVIAHRFHTSTGAETEQTGGHSTLSTRP